VEVHANSEVGLADQIRELSARVKQLEKQLAASEEAKVKLIDTLDTEREVVRKATTPRNLTTEEKADCKACVQALFTASKEIVALKNEDNKMSDAEVLAATSSIQQASQEHLYQSVQGMDKNILVELCIALGGLVQSMYIEREKAKAEEAKRVARKAQKAEKTVTKTDDGDDHRRKTTSAVEPIVSQMHLPSPPASVSSVFAPAANASTGVSSPLPSSSSGISASPMPVSSNSIALAQFTPPGPATTGAATGGKSTGLTSGGPVNSSAIFTNSVPSNAAVQVSTAIPTPHSPQAQSSTNNSIVVPEVGVALGQTSPRQLSEEQRQLLVNGAPLKKVARGMFGVKQNRRVSITEDFQSIVWKAVKTDGEKESKKSPTVNPMRAFTR
jgi:hypothetical protein